MTEDTKPFTVKDRRHFNAAGEARDENAVPEPAAGMPGADSPGSPVEGPPPERHHYPADFSGLLISLGAQAAASLSTEPPDLQGATALIRLLEILQEKSAGRRTAEEDHLLESLLFELRMGFVSRRRSSPA